MKLLEETTWTLSTMYKEQSSGPCIPIHTTYKIVGHDAIGPTCDIQKISEMHNWHERWMLYMKKKFEKQHQHDA